MRNYIYSKRLHLKSIIYFFLFLSFIPQFSYALILPLPEQGNDLVGQLQYFKPKWGQEFHGIGRSFDVGYEELVHANPTLDPVRPSRWKKITIPTLYLLPPGPRVGIVINLAEMRLYYYPANSNIVATYPLGIGQEGWQTPQGLLYIYEKIPNPTWHVPPSIKEKLAKQNINVPDNVLPGPENPLGNFALRLSPLRSYLIHGTNNPLSIGMRSSSGCVRLFPEDIEDFFQHVPQGTPVQIINEPFKVGWHNGKLYLEAHAPLKEDNTDAGEDLTPMMKQIYSALRYQEIDVNWQRATMIALEHSGIPQVISVGAPKSKNLGGEKIKPDDGIKSNNSSEIKQEIPAQMSQTPPTEEVATSAPSNSMSEEKVNTPVYDASNDFLKPIEDAAGKYK